MAGLKERIINGKEHNGSYAKELILEEGGVGHKDRSKKREAGKSRTKNQGGKPTTKR